MRNLRPRQDNGLSKAAQLVNSRGRNPSGGICSRVRAFIRYPMVSPTAAPRVHVQGPLTQANVTYDYYACHQHAPRATGVNIMEAEPTWCFWVESTSITWVHQDNCAECELVEWDGSLRCCQFPVSLQFSEATGHGRLVVSGLIPMVYNRIGSLL